MTLSDHFEVFLWVIVTECTCNSGVLGGAPRSSLPGEFQNLRRQEKRKKIQVHCEIKDPPAQQKSIENKPG